MTHRPAHDIRRMTACCLGRARARLACENASAAVEYIGLGLVVSMMMASLAAAVDSQAGDRLVEAIVGRLVGMVSGDASA